MSDDPDDASALDRADPATGAEDDPTPALESPATEWESEGSAGDSRDGPLGELAADARRRSDERTDAAYDDLFVSEDVGNLDSDLVWEELETGSISVADEDGLADEHVVPTSSYCESCEYFSTPPEVACGHAGTEIVEMVDVDRFTVRNCPKVAEDIAVGEFDPEDK